MSLLGPSASVMVLAKSTVATGLVALATAVATVGVLPPATAQAASPTPATEVVQQRINARLERALQREQNVLVKEQARLDRTSNVVTKTQTYIADQKAKGHDTSGLSSALATFQQATATAKTSHDAASAALSTKAGFDANGQVSDVAQARATLKTVGQAERQFHLTMHQAAVDFHTVLKEYRIANRPTPTATPSGGA